MGFSMECFTADFLQFFAKKSQNFTFGWTTGYLVFAECSYTIKSMLVGFVFIGGWCYSEWCVWDLIALAQFPGSEMSAGLFQDSMDLYIKP